MKIKTDEFSKKEWGLLFVLCGAIFLDSLDVSMIGVALPSIQTDFHMTTSSLQWVVSAYVLGYGGFLLLGGRAADLYGRRRMFLASLVVFLVASSIGGMASNATVLIASRFIKGISAAFTAPAGLSIITTMFAAGPHRSKALAIYAATGASGFSLGLVIGGVLTEFGWRYTFSLPVVVSLVTFLAARKYIPTEHRGQSSGSFDIIGALSITSTVLVVVFGLVQAPSVGWATTQTILTFIAALVALTIFVIAERRNAFPLIRLGMLRSPSVFSANIAAMVLLGSWIAFLFVATLYTQELREWSALKTGLAMFPSGLMVVLLASRIGPLVGRHGTRPLIAAGLSCSTLAYALFLRIDMHSSYVTGLLPTVILGGLGFALAYGPLNIAATTDVASHEQGVASGLINTSFQFGGALVLAVASAVFAAHSGSASTSKELLNGFHAATVVSLAFTVGGLLITLVRPRRRTLSL